MPAVMANFRETVTHYPKGLEAQAVTIDDAIVNWASADWEQKFGVGYVDVSATITLPVDVTVYGGGRDAFVLTDPATGSAATLVVDSMTDKTEAFQTWTLKALDVREISRKGYRGRN